MHSNLILISSRVRFYARQEVYIDQITIAVLTLIRNVPVLSY